MVFWKRLFSSDTIAAPVPTQFEGDFVEFFDEGVIYQVVVS